MRSSIGLARPRGDLPHALPRRPLPRPARDAEDVLAARSARCRSPSTGRRACATSSARSGASSGRLTLPGRARRAARRRGARARRLPDPRLPGRPRRLGASATRSSRTSGRAASTSRRADALGVPFGPERGALQRGEAVTLADGRVVDAGRVLGGAARRAARSSTRRHRAGRGGRVLCRGRRRARPRGDVRRARSATAPRRRCTRPRGRPPRSRATPACGCSRSRTSRRATSAPSCCARRARSSRRRSSRATSTSSRCRSPSAASRTS